MKHTFKIMDGNEAAAYIAYKTNEVCAIYPITPSSAMGEHCDDWSAEGKKNIFGNIPRVVEMQSEGGAAGAVHGALMGGALTTTFTSSQGLLLMIPDMFKIAGELTPFVLNVAARTIATHALSIFGDHSDVMSVRSTGFAMLFGNNPQEVMDMTLIAECATLKSRVPFMNIFDGFRTSHELQKVNIIPDEIILSLLDEKDINAHRNRSLNPNKPIIKGTAQNPDVFFQHREACSPYYNNLPAKVQDLFDAFAKQSGRSYKLYEYYGSENAEKLIIIMGSGGDTVEEVVDYLNTKDQKVGVLKVRLYRPFASDIFIKAIPTTVKKIAVLDRTKEPGAVGEPLYQDVITAFTEQFIQKQITHIPTIIGGRYGLSSKEFNPAMVLSIYDELDKSKPKNHFTIGIIDDISNSHLLWDNDFNLEEQHTFRGLFYGLGADGTVSANKNSIKIIGETTENYVQGYFVYDSKKSGSGTVSHLRFGKNPIKSIYLIQSANFIACHNFNFLGQVDMLSNVKENSTFLLNSPFDAIEVWENIPAEVQKQIIDKKLHLYIINASKVARETGMGNRINGVLQTCFFAISNIIPKDQAIEKIKSAIAKTYAAKGQAVVDKNYAAVDKTLENLFEVNYPKTITGLTNLKPDSWKTAPDFVSKVLSEIMRGNGDSLPSSLLPIGGVFPTATTKFEKRNIAQMVPVWDKDICTQCNKCAFICPHAAIRAKVYDKNLLSSAPNNFEYLPPVGKEFNKETEAYTLQVAVEDCTGCNLCVEYCPAESKTKPGHKAINMADRIPILENEKSKWNYFLSIPEIDRSRISLTNVKGTQFLQPLFEFSGACAGCGETPYLKLLTQLFGDRMVVANATGCSSIYGGNLPTTPWSTNKNGRGPAWANSLFEDNAEFGLGIRIALNHKYDSAIQLLQQLENEIGKDLVSRILNETEANEESVANQHKNIDELREKLKTISNPLAERLLNICDDISKKSMWIVGGDGWAYDIGFGGLDHILASGENVNILVMDTEVYSNTGGQTSKATPMGAIARFSAGGKKSSKKSLGFMAINYKNVYVAQIAMGASDTQALRAIKEAESYPGTSLIIAYSHCIAHGYDMAHGAKQQNNAVKSGYWPLFRYNPANPIGKRFALDSKEASLPLADYIYNEGRYLQLQRKNPDLANELLAISEEEIKDRWQQMQGLINL